MDDMRLCVSWGRQLREEARNVEVVELKSERIFRKESK